jgi:hypothetical protein
MLLSEQDRNHIEDDLEQPIGKNAFDAIEAAILARLASAELPATVWVDVPHFTYTAAQLQQAHAQGFAAGAAAQLAQEPLCYVRNGEINRWNGLSGMGFSGPLYTRREAK